MKAKNGIAETQLLPALLNLTGEFVDSKEEMGQRLHTVLKLVNNLNNNRNNHLEIYKPTEHGACNSVLPAGRSLLARRWQPRAGD